MIVSSAMRSPRPLRRRATTATLVAVAVLLAPSMGPRSGPEQGAGERPSGPSEAAANIGASSTVAAAATRAPRLKPPLRVRKGRIVNRGGKPVRLLSIALNQLGPGDGQHGKTARGYASWNRLPSYAYGDVRSWGFNSVRLPISWANLEPEAPTRDADGNIVARNWNQDYLDALDEAVRGFTSRGIGIILEMQQVRWSPAFTDLPLPGGRTMPEGWGLPKWLYPKEGGVEQMIRAKKRFFIRGQHQAAFRNAWRFVARRYAGNRRVVGVSIMNEPYDLLTSSHRDAKRLRPKRLKLAQFYERAGRQIHRVNPRLLLLFQEFKSRRLNMWSLTRKPRMNKAVMDNHFYGPRWEKSGRKWVTEAYQRARGWNAPLWIGEFMAFNRSIGYPDRPRWRKMTRQMLAFAKQRDIGWAVWLYGQGQFQRSDNIRVPKPRLLPTIRSGF